MAEIVLKTREFILKCARVWAVMRKPTREEFKIIAQSAGIGMLVVGLIGFAVSVLFRLLLSGKLFTA